MSCGATVLAKWAMATIIQKLQPCQIIYRVESLWQGYVQDFLVDHSIEDLLLWCELSEIIDYAILFSIAYFQTSQRQKQQQRGKDSIEQEGMQTQKEGKNISGVSMKGGKGTQRQGKRKKKQSEW